MRENNVVSGEVREEVRRMLGGPLDPPLDSASILASVDDHIYIWNSREQSILALNQSCRGENRLQTLNLADCPQHAVTGISVSGTGRWITVYGEEGVTAVEVPRRSGAEGRLGAGEPELLCRTISVYRERDNRKVQKAAWHPGSQGENHLLVLTTDGSLTLYLVGEQTCRVFHQVNLGGSRVATALGETAVDFCFGAAVEGDGGNVWPIFVLWADGDVFYVVADLTEDWRVEGPVEVLPAQAEDFSVESCSILAVGEKAGPAVLVVARVGGTVLHHVMLGDPASGKLSLHLYQQVELDLGPLNSCDSVFSCPVRLIADSSSRSRYLVIHGSGLHQVEIPILAGEEQLDSELQCVVEHLICTRPTLDSPPAPILGAAVSYPPPTIVCLMADNSIHTLKSKPSSSYCIPLASLSETSSTDPKDSYRSCDNIQERIKLIISRDSTQPLIFSAPGANVTQTETLELLSRATETLKKEYITKILKAREELSAEVKVLRGKKASQETLLTKLETARTELREKAERISEKYEDVKDRGSGLAARVEAVLAKVQTKVPTASDAELKMLRDVKALQVKLDQIQAATEQLKEKEKYQRYQIECASKQLPSRALSAEQVENVKEVLQGDSGTITDLVKAITAAKKDISA